MFCPFDLFFRKLNPLFDISDIAGLQKLISKHRYQWGSQRHGYAEIDTFVDLFVKDVDERNVGFGNCLKEPVFFQKLAVFRMTDKRQVSVQN